MKRKISRYLNSKEKCEYDNLDKIFELFLNGNIKELLSEYVGVGIYPSFNKLGKTIQLNYNYQNIYVIIDFFEDKYDIVVYYAGIKEEELEKLFIDYDYKNDFVLEKVIKEIDIKIKNHPKLKDTTLIEKKKKIYSTIAWSSLCLPLIICGSIGLYCVITKNDLKGNMWWGIFFIVIPLIVWIVFYVKSKKLK
ncbi:hypothetical protein [Thomasclavelia cocleata]|uniref:hypothetical protein n=1 Tax=Thomasclavelia cocleata TaxID=69824 RepID=UPI0025737778|nr:hypothetical protein [Thomasclavelia cocleata]